jgi:hypothetical protein
LKWWGKLVNNRTEIEFKSLKYSYLELNFERGNNVKFTSLVRELEAMGTLVQSKVRIIKLF